MQVAAAIEFRPEEADPWVVVGLTRGGSPGLHRCKGLAEAESHAEAETLAIAKSLAEAERWIA